VNLEPELLAELAATFAMELEEQLQQITDRLLQLEQGRGVDDADHYSVIFRAAHNLKGAAAGVGADAIATIAHRLETLFDRLKRADAVPGSQLVDTTLAAIDGIRQLQSVWRLGETLPAAGEALLGELQQLLDEAPLLLTATEVPPSGAGESAAVANEPPAPPRVDAAVLVGEANAAPRHVPPPAANTNRLVRTDVRRLAAISVLAEELEMSRNELQDSLEQLDQLTCLLKSLTRQSSSRGLLPWARSQRTPQTEVVVPWQEESEATLRQLRSGSAILRQRLLHGHQQLSRVSQQLRENVQQLRLEPAANLLRPLLRTVRDMGRELGKEVVLQSEGDSIELDRLLLEGLRDPLIHLLRNAIDHGIERPEQRRAAGKAAAGTIRLALSHAAGRVRLQVSDDGAGIDPQRVLQVAIERQLISSDQAQQLSVNEALEWVFHPGFSTRSEVSTLSGRGVGLDVVRANIQALNGRVTLSSEPGVGSQFLLDLPLSLATDQGLIVSSQQQRYVIPATAVVRVLPLAHLERTELAGQPALLYESRPYPLIALHQLLELTIDPNTHAMAPAVVLISHGWNSVGLLVDEVVGELEMVIKQLRPPLRRVRNISGATVDGSGNILMVLNPADLIAAAHRSNVATLPMPELSTIKARVLIADDSITTRTLERNILEQQGYQVLLATHGEEAWQRLQQEPIDLLISDAEMPQLDGFALTRRIRHSERLRHLPVILVTSLGSAADRERGSAAGVSAYLVKSSFTGETLLKRVEQLLATAAAQPQKKRQGA